MGFLDFIFNFINNKKKNVQIIAEDLSKIYKGSEALELGLYSEKEPLINKNISIEINGKNYDRTTNENGIAKLNINLPIGKYKAFFTFAGDDEYKTSKGHVLVYVNPKIEASDLHMSEKDGSKFTIILKDNDGNKLPNTKIDFKVNGRIYNKTTDENGQASLTINLLEGQYKINILINNINIEKTIFIDAPKQMEIQKDNKHFGYWVFGKDMKNVNLQNFKNNGVTDIFLNYYAFTVHGENEVLKWAKQAKDLGINTHIWMQCFYDGEWHNPKTSDLTDKLNEAKKYANMNDIYGIHLDYLRYPGNAYKTDGGVEAINTFVKNIRSVVGSKFLSCAIMPENGNIKYYGQDIEALGKIVDTVIPMQYKGNYNANTNWLATTTKNFSSKATIWSGLQSYKSDDDTAILSSNELSNDIITCLNNGAKGVILFRYGISENINFPSETKIEGKKPTKMEGTNINMTYKDGTQYQCAVYDDNGRIAVPVTLSINGKDYIKTPDINGLYKLNINLTPGNYTLNAKFNGDENYLGSSITNNITINEVKKEVPKQESFKLYDYFTNQGGGYLGQRTGYTCGPHCLMQCIHRLTGEDVSEMELAAAAGTTTNGTDHEGLGTAIEWFNKKYNYNLKINWKNFSEVGFDGLQKAYENGAVFLHLLYREQWGHYEVPLTSNTDPNKILNSLGTQYSDGYYGYIESRNKTTQKSYINGISQKSVCIITR